MRIYPAIDIIDGACVRLVQGDYSQKTSYADEPREVALRWRSEGGEFLHIVDLDGARSGSTPNFDLICDIASSVGVPIEVGGGIRSLATAEKYLNSGVERVIIGTSALSDPNFVAEACAKYGDRIAVGIDAKDGFAAINGWEEVSRTAAVELAVQMAGLGVKYIIYTDIATDGMLKGPNIAAMRDMTAAVPSVNIIASGGVSSAEDVAALAGTGVEGAIIGKALYTGRVTVADALRAAEQS